MGLEVPGYAEARRARVAAESLALSDWVSGSVVPKYASRVSIADKEIYQRMTTGPASSVDPADDLVNYESRSWARPKAWEQGLTSGFLSHPGAAVTNSMLGAITSQPALPLNTRTSVLSITGKGAIKYLGCLHPMGSNLRVRRIELVVDGRVVFDRSATFLNSGVPSGLVIVGSTGIGYNASQGTQMMAAAVPSGELPYRRSFQVFITVSTAADNAGDFYFGYINQPV